MIMLLTQIYGSIVLSLKDKRLVYRNKKSFAYKDIATKASPVEAYGTNRG